MADIGELARRVTSEGKNLRGIVKATSAMCGVSVRLQALHESALTSGGLTGMLRINDSLATIYYASNAPVSYQVHCVFHEVGHLCLGHTGCDLAFQATQAALFFGSRRGGQARERQAERFAHQLMRIVLSPEQNPAEAALG